MVDLSRTPPIAVRRELRQEVGFRCPVEACGNPYLSWHHFDPPWAVEHATRADGGAFPDDELRRLKREGRDLAATIVGRFDWMRREFLAAVGGNFYYDCPVLLRIGQRDCIWFSRDDRGYALVNFWMPTAADQPRAQIVENGWVVPPIAADVECPPSGRRLRVWYANGDRIAIDFIDVPEPAALVRRYPDANVDNWGQYVRFPTTVVEVTERAEGTPIEFGPRETRLPGGNILRNSFIGACGVAVQLDIPGFTLPPAEET